MNGSLQIGGGRALVCFVSVQPLTLGSEWGSSTDLIGAFLFLLIDGIQALASVWLNGSVAIKNAYNFHKGAIHKYFVVFMVIDSFIHEVILLLYVNLCIRILLLYSGPDSILNLIFLISLDFTNHGGAYYSNADPVRSLKCLAGQGLDVKNLSAYHPIILAVQHGYELIDQKSIHLII
ncbi:hypothetical protein ACJX0J_007380, partial [Zea mays]